MLGTIAQPNKSRPRIIAPFDPLPWQIAPWRDKSPVLLLTGSAGGGKSRLAAEKLHGYCLKYPGATALMARKVKASMASGTVLFLRRKIIGADPSVRFIDSPKLRFEYRNGSILAFVGLQDEDARENLKSIGQDGAVDIAAMEEGSQFAEEDLNAMVARMRGKAASWRQIIIPTNPDAPTHWIKRRLIDGGEARVYYSSARDNFHNPADYEAWLATLTGIDYERLVLGKWVQATGIVYDVWSDGPSDGNVTEAADYLPGTGEIYWAVDDGYEGKLDVATGHFTERSSPRVFLLVQQRADGWLCVFAEHYAVKVLQEEHIRQVVALGYPEPDYAVVDSAAAELRGRLLDAGIATFGKPGSIEESIKTTRRMLAPDASGRRRVQVHPRCTHLRAEMASYRRDDNGKPVDALNHGPDALRYLCWHLRLE
jgi:phage terminase large subunit